MYGKSSYRSTYIRLGGKCRTLGFYSETQGAIVLCGNSTAVVSCKNTATDRHCCVFARPRTPATRGREMPSMIHCHVNGNFHTSESVTIGRLDRNWRTSETAPLTSVEAPKKTSLFSVKFYQVPPFFYISILFGEGGVIFTGVFFLGDFGAT